MSKSAVIECSSKDVLGGHYVTETVGSLSKVDSSLCCSIMDNSDESVSSSESLDFDVEVDFEVVEDFVVEVEEDFDVVVVDGSSL